MRRQKRKVWDWRCDFKDCEEIAQWYRKRRGELLKLCTKHNVYLHKQHWGRHIDFSELDEDDRRYLLEKDEDIPSRSFWSLFGGAQS